MTVRLWDWAAPEDALVRVWDHHSEFAVGLDWSTLAEGLLARWVGGRAGGGGRWGCRCGQGDANWRCGGAQAVPLRFCWLH